VTTEAVATTAFAPLLLSLPDASVEAADLARSAEKKLG